MFRGTDPKGLDPVTTDREVDPPFNVCFNRPDIRDVTVGTTK